jgi:hypothetical protein
MKAIETIYGGYRFRSRLEARWAMFFDTLGLHWEYEAEGYDLDKRGWYLPDFLIKSTGRWNYWVEIKPMLSNLYVGAEWYAVEDPKFTHDFNASLKLAALVESGQRFRECKYGLTIYGEPYYDRHQVLITVDTDSFGSPEDTVCTLGSCWECDALTVGYADHWYIISETKTSQFFKKLCPHSALTPCSRMLDYAFAQAQQARFER